MLEKKIKGRLTKKLNKSTILRFIKKPSVRFVKIKYPLFSEKLSEFFITFKKGFIKI